MVIIIIYNIIYMVINIYIKVGINQTKIQTFINIKVQVLINKLEFGAATLNDNLKKSR